MRRNGDSEWKTVAKSSKPLYVGLGPYKEPFTQGNDKQGPTTGLLDISHYLGYKKKTPSEARNAIVENMYPWMKMRGFLYEGERRDRLIGLLDYKGGNANFWYMGFMTPAFDNDPNTVFTGDCRHVSALYAMCCAAVGVEMKLGFNYSPGIKIYTKPVKPCGALEAIRIYENGSSYVVEQEPTFASRGLSFHQFGWIDNNVWDPLYYFQNGFFALGMPLEPTYQNTLIESYEGTLTWLKGVSLKISESFIKP